MAAVLGKLQPLRVRGEDVARGGWFEATFRIETIESAAIEVLSLSPHVEVIEPEELREEVVDRLGRATALYEAGAPGRASELRPN